MAARKPRMDSIKGDAYKEEQKKAREAMSTRRMVWDTSRKGQMYAHVREFKQAFIDSLSTGIVKGKRGEVSAQVKKFKEDAWRKK